jgi:hypothetical protein
MDPHQLRAALDELSLPDGEAARLLYITPNALWQYLQGKRKIPGPMVAAIEAWQRHGPPPDAKTAKETIEPGKLALMKQLRDSLADEPEQSVKKKKSKKTSNSAE